MYQQRHKNVSTITHVSISHVSMRKGDKNSPRTSTCDDFPASTIAISGVRCYTVEVRKYNFTNIIAFELHRIRN